jgi:mannose-6-phosphate isomerase-like protein (cupin superfamily)
LSLHTSPFTSAFRLLPSAFRLLPSAFAICLPVLVQTPPTQSTDTIARSVIVDRGGFQAVRVEYAPGAIEPPGPHAYDVVIVPIDSGMSLELEGKPASWQPGLAILIPRGAPHRIRNASKSRVAFISVRRLADATIKPAAPPQTNGATIIRSADSPYVRATTLRVERQGELRSPAAAGAGPALFVLAGNGDVRMTIGSAVSDFPQQRIGTVWLFDPGTPFGLINIGSRPFEVVRISAPPASAGKTSR